jgi:hypothetical protein
MELGYNERCERVGDRNSLTVMATYQYWLINENTQNNRN